MSLEKVLTRFVGVIFKLPIIWDVNNNFSMFKIAHGFGLEVNIGLIRLSTIPVRRWPLPVLHRNRRFGPSFAMLTI